ncbi:PLP-dependent aminotransferase family protein [Shimia thalassica]|uniref:MocR-like pyridoxine biosynthesis transcription factor PdxR n=1 Tax=Shimia thalassica TaxID=1715693 RepID=UPI002734CF49|nr:PLP-dependent aminotransferase family protein [Shimia thalassica]MDP2493035.1 PLP-dependent aminotransferase family protein [Shimia thalassica]
MTLTPWLAFSIDRGAKTPVFEQICQAIRDKAHAGDLTAGTRLPPTRGFAVDLGVSRSTVVTAYEQLVAEGYLSSVQGAGYTICALGDVELPRPQNPKSPSQDATLAPKPRPFAASLPDMRLFPHRQWARSVARVCRTNPQSMLINTSPFGNPDLRRAISDHVAEWRGIKAEADQIIVTAGAVDALEICMRTLASAGALVGLEDPGYSPLRSFVASQGLSPTFLNVTGDGAELPAPDTPPELVVLTPSHQYPLGGAMSPNRRLEFLNWADRTNAWIIEDDYDSEFRYAGRPIPAMAGFDHLRRTIYVGSFSKVFSNALRIGYLIVPKGLTEQFAATLHGFGVKASLMPQQALADFIFAGEFYRHIRRVRRIYGDRRKYLLERLARDFGEWGYCADHQAGMQVVLHLHEGIKDVDIAKEMDRAGLHAQALSRLCQNASHHNGLILGYCAFSEEETGPALDALLTCFQRASHSAIGHDAVKADL